PRSSGRYKSAMSAKPTTHVIASAAPCTRRAANSHGRLSAKANSSVAAASAASPPTIGAFRPVRSDTAPIGMDTVRSVTPNEANSSPMTVGDAPSRRLRSGSTGTATPYATMSVKQAKVTSATATAREVRRDIATKPRKHERESLVVFALSCFRGGVQERLLKYKHTSGGTLRPRAR